MGNERPFDQWPAVEIEYRAGLSSDRDLANRYGLSASAIRTKATAEGWVRATPLIPGRASTRQAAQDTLRHATIRLVQMGLSAAEVQAQVADAAKAAWISTIPVSDHPQKPVGIGRTEGATLGGAVASAMQAELGASATEGEIQEALAAMGHRVSVAATLMELGGHAPNVVQAWVAGMGEAIGKAFPTSAP